MKTFDLVLKNGLVVDPHNNIRGECDIGIDGGKIAKVGHNLSGREEYNATGKVVMPGVIDMHTHMAKQWGANAYRQVAGTGITTLIDFAGPLEEIKTAVATNACGMNVGIMEAVQEGKGSITDKNPSKEQLEEFIEEQFEQGALGIKLLCGHNPLTPNAIETAIKLANEQHKIIAYHAGSTENKSDLNGMKEAIELSKGRPFILAHINAYCRGRTAPALVELNEAFELLRKNPQIMSDSHMAVMNSTGGHCEDDIPVDHITSVCLELFGYPANSQGIEQGIKDRIISVIGEGHEGSRLFTGTKALALYQKKDGDVAISFPANLPAVAAACVTERINPGGEFLIPMTSTDGGAIPRNNLIHRILMIYSLGYISLDEVVKKVSYNPAKVFGLLNKGHLSEGADADITVLNLTDNQAVLSVIDGKITMCEGKAIDKPGKLLINKTGEKQIKEQEILYDVIDTSKSQLYVR